MRLSSFVVGQAIFLTGFNAIVIPDSPKGTRDENGQQDLSVEVEFLPSRNSAVAYYFATEIKTLATQQLFQSTSSADALKINSAMVIKGEGGLAVELYNRRNDPAPSVTISFVIDIHEPVALPHFDHDYRVHNVEVLVSHEKGQNESYEMIKLRKVYPQILNLQV